MIINKEVTAKEMANVLAVKLCGIVHKKSADLTLLTSPTERFVIGKVLSGDLKDTYVAIVNHAFVMINEKINEAVVRKSDVLCFIEPEEHEVEVILSNFKEPIEPWLGR